jgi:AraC-like DNA-binding protein
MTVISILNFIQNHFRSAIRLSDVSKAVNLSERQVQRLLSSKMNDGFHSLLTQHRITAVKTLMASDKEKRSLEALALECGFSNYVSFWKQFKKLTGFTPEEYRANINKA